MMRSWTSPQAEMRTPQRLTLGPHTLIDILHEVTNRTRKFHKQLFESVKKNSPLCYLPE